MNFVIKLSSFGSTQPFKTLRVTRLWLDPYEKLSYENEDCISSSPFEFVCEM